MKKLTAEEPETKSADLVGANIEELKRLFPECVVEGKIDFDVLKQLLGGAVDEKDEKFGLNWHGKRRARQLALTPSTGTLLPCPEESVDWDTTKNLMIEGDNLEVLKLLQKSYAGMVKMIYIDPPYNTGKDFVYRDRFQDSLRNYLELTGQLGDDRRTILSNPEVSGRFHTDWLNMMYPRLHLARQLMRDDGLIACSIDDGEVSRLRLLFDEVFGEENFVAQLVWRTDGNFDNQAKVKVCHEYVLLYARSSDNFPYPPVVDPSTPQDSKLFRPEIRNTIIKNGPKNPVSSLRLPRGFPAAFESGCVAARVAPWPIYRGDAIVEQARLVEPVVVESGWSSKAQILEFIENGCSAIHDAKGQETTFLLTASGAIEAIKRRSECTSHVISVLSGFGGTQRATAELTELGAHFDGYPKPLDLIEYLLQLVDGSDAIVLDFFAGAGPVGHAAMRLNASDSGSRRYMLVQLPEVLDSADAGQRAAAEYCDRLGLRRTVAELTKERLRRAGAKVKADHPMFAGDTGFRVMKLASSNVKTWTVNDGDVEASLLSAVDNVAHARSERDLLYELLLKLLGLDLCIRIESRAISGKTVHSIGAGVLIACLAETIGRDDVESLADGIAAWRAELNPAGDTTCVFRDSAFEDDVAKTNLAAILHQAGIKTVRSL